MNKVIALLLVFVLNFAVANEVFAYFSDVESSTNNVFAAASLDFFVTEENFDTYIGKEAMGEYVVASAVIQSPDSLDIQYVANIEKNSGNDDFCNGLDLEATQNGIEVHDDDLFLLNTATTTDFGTWEFEFDLPPTVTNVGHGDVCDFDIVLSGWREDVTDPSNSGFSDEERINFSLTSKMVLMNEMLPDPVGSDSQSGLDGEWVELYNNGDTDVDIGGWVISELANPSGTPTEKFYTIVSTSPGVGEVTTSSGSTVITAGGFLVVMFEASRLNNTGDTVTLYNSSSNQMDQHTYVNGEAPEGKSIARIPDGLGIWVDPIPTPGDLNILDDESAAAMQQVVEETEDTKVNDTEAPVITVIGNNPALIEQGSEYSDLGARVTDNVNDNLGITAEGEDIETLVLGEYEVLYTATDQAGNRGSATRLVIVYDPADGVPQIEEEVVVEEITLAPPSVEEIIEVVEPEEEVVEEIPVEEEIIEEEAPIEEEPEIVEESTEEPIVEEEVVEEPTEEETPPVEEEPPVEEILEEVEAIKEEEAPLEETTEETTTEEVVEEITEDPVVEEEPVEEELPVVEEVIEEPTE